MQRYETIVFDLDGTLIDSVPDLAWAANEVLAEAGADPLEVDTVRGFVGNGVPRLVERALDAANVAFEPKWLELFHEIYSAEPVRETEPYPHVEAALDHLAREGMTLAIATNKPEAPCRTILAHFGWADVFDRVVGGDTLPVRKPDPAPLFDALGATAPDRVLFVGDSEVDAATSEAAEIDFALFTEGYRKAPAEALPAIFRFDDYEAFPEFALQSF